VDEATERKRQPSVGRPSGNASQPDRGWIELGNVLASQEKYEPALASYARARQQRPQDSQTIFRMAWRWRNEPACRGGGGYRAAIRLTPANWDCF